VIIKNCIRLVVLSMYLVSATKLEMPAGKQQAFPYHI